MHFLTSMRANQGKEETFFFSFQQYTIRKLFSITKQDPIKRCKGSPFKTQKLFQTSTPKFLKMTERKLSLYYACKGNFCYNVKKTYFPESLMQMKKQTIFTSINKRKIKLFFLYFSRKYEAHKAVFSTKETNLLGRGYRISFQKKIFKYLTKKKTKIELCFQFPL